MALAVACLHLFAQSNWTGPPILISISDLLPPAVVSQVYYFFIPHKISHIILGPLSFIDSITPANLSV